MYLCNDKESIEKFQIYCNKNYNQKESKKYFMMYLMTILQLDIEKILINKINNDKLKVYKAYGNYASEIVFILQKYDKNALKILNSLLKAYYKKDISNFCILFYEKTNIELNQNTSCLINLYNDLFKKELKITNNKQILNLSRLKFNSNQIKSFDYNEIATLKTLAAKEDKTNEERIIVNNISKSFITMLLTD